MTVGRYARHAKKPIYSESGGLVIDWKDAPNARTRTVYNMWKDRLERQIKFGDVWFTYDAFPCTRIEDYFASGVMDLTATFPCVISDVAYYCVTDGTGSVKLLTLHGGAMHLITGNSTGDETEICAGDITQIRWPWDINREPFFNVRFRFPRAEDYSQSFMLLGLVQDTPPTVPHIAIRYDPTGVDYDADPNLLFVTRYGALAETISVLGAPDTDWHEIWIHVTRDLVTAVFDGGATIRHTTNIPADDHLMHYCILETREDSLKTFDINHLIILQDRP